MDKSRPDLLPPQDILKSPGNIDHMLSEELFQLPLHDRNAIEEETHGISSLAPEESAEFLNQALKSLESELEGIPETDLTRAYHQSRQLGNDTYIAQRNFRLRFLRCELFDAKKAATRMIRFLDLAYDLVGPTILQRPLGLSDLSRNEKKLLQIGNLQVWPYRDRSGRPVVSYVGDFAFRQGTDRERLMVVLYILYTVSDDEESQRKGCTHLVWIGQAANFEGSFPTWVFYYARRIFESVPLRTVASHFCTPDKPFVHMFRAAYGLALGAYLPRIKFHLGDDIKVLHALKSYGIPIDLLPVTDSGNIKTTYWKKWIRARNHLEQARVVNTVTLPIVICPNSMDVLFRVGCSHLSHPGNSMFQNLIESHLMQSKDSQHKQTVPVMAHAIVDTVLLEGRFLQWDGRGWWTVLDEEPQVHSKVVEKIRFHRQKLAARQYRSTEMNTIADSNTNAFCNQDHRKRRKKIDEGCCL